MAAVIPRAIFIRPHRRTFRNQTTSLESQMIYRIQLLPGQTLRIALVIAPLVIAACLIGLPYGPNGIAFAFSAAMTLWVVPHVVWCLHNTMISPWDFFSATWRPFLASIVAATFAFVVQFYVSQVLSPFWRLSGGGVMVGLYLWIFLFVMGQKSFYFDLLRGLKSSPHPT